MANKRNDISTTTPTKSGSLCVRTLAKSMKKAVFPLTSTWIPVPAVASGKVELRKWLTKVVVAASWGAVRG